MAALTVLSGLWAPSGHAAIVYNFNAAEGYTTSDQPLRLADGTDFTSGSERPFSTNPMQPASGYSGPAFFGGFVNSDDPNNDPLAVVEFDNTGGSDPIDFRVGGNNVEWDALIMGDTGMDLVFDSTSSVVIGNNRGSFGSLNTRLVLRDTSGSYYISDTEVQTLTSGGVTTDTLDATALDALTFNSYDPATSLVYTSDPSSFDPFTDSWDAAGVLLDYGFGGNSDRNTAAEFHQLTVDAALIPEPSSLWSCRCLAWRAWRGDGGASAVR